MNAAVASPVTTTADLLVCDHGLRDGDGFDAMAAVRARFGGVPAVMVTADTTQPARDALHASGLIVLNKPFRPDALLAASAEAVRRA